jgi:hypothetical protein
MHWRVPRPAYVREAEPLAHPGAWPSLSEAELVDPVEQNFNRQLFSRGRGRKTPLPAAGEKHDGKDQGHKKAG